jgi:Carboxypeptidase regulatory-like domain
MRQRHVLRVAVVLCLSIVAYAQSNATVGGTVSDAAGAVIPGVEVNATNVNTGIMSTQVTNETGTYNFASLQPGAYKFSAGLPGFQTQTFQSVTLSQSQQVRLNFTLQVAESRQTVEVVTDMNVSLATSSASVGDLLPQAEVQSLPVPVRDVLQLISSTAGTGAERSFAGQGIRAVNFSRDGIVINDTRYGVGNDFQGQNATYVSSDLVEELQVVTAAADAEAAGGSAQVRLQTRSGANQYHGALFLANNNSALNANDWFNNQKGAPKSYVNQNQYGGRLGGPIIKNRAFFFVLIDNQKYIAKQTTNSIVFTDLARQGIFRYSPGRRNANAQAASPSVDYFGNPLYPITSFNLFTDVNDPYRTGMTTVPYWRDVLSKQMPSPNDFTIGDGLNTAGIRWLQRYDGLNGGNSVGNLNNRKQLNTRVDYQVSKNNKVSFQMSRELDTSVQTRIWPTGIDGTSAYYPHVYTAQWTSVISPKVLNEFRIGRIQSGFHQRSPFQLDCCSSNTNQDRNETAQALFDTLPKVNGFPMYVTTAATNAGFSARPTFDPAAYISEGFATTRGNYNPQWQFSDSLGWVRGKHSFKIGGEVWSYWSNGWNTTVEQFPKAVIGDGPTPASITSARFPGLDANDGTLAREILNDLSGSIRGFTQGYIINSSTQTKWDDFNTESRRFRWLSQNDWSAFFKDTWNATTNLTLNLGLRYDKFGVLYDASGLLPNAVGGQAGAFGISGTDWSAMWQPGASGGSLTQIQLVGKHSPNPKPFYPDQWHNFAPSVGFSYKIPFVRRTVLRGGYGVNYAAKPIFLDYELAFLNNPGSVDREAQPTGTLGYNFLNLDSAIANRVLPLKPSFQPNPAQSITVPLTDRSQIIYLMGAHRPTPYVQTFNFSVQHELKPQMTLEVSYVGTKGTHLYHNRELNETNIFENGFLDAFNVTRAGGTAPLFDQMMSGLNVPGAGVVNGATLTGSQALRLYASTRNFIADGNIGALADFLNRSANITGVPGGFLRNGRLPENFFVVNPQFYRTELWLADGNSTYHSMRAQLRQTLAHGLSGEFTYVWSKALGDAISGSTGVRDAAMVLNPRRPMADNKGRLSFDRTQTVNARGTWELPFGPGKPFLAGAPAFVQRAVGGWTLSSITTFTTGAPLNLTSGISGVSGSILSMSGTQSMSVPDLVGALSRSVGRVEKGKGFVQYFEGLSSVAAPLPDFGSDPANLKAVYGARAIVDNSGRPVLMNPQPGKVGTLGLRYLTGPGHFLVNLGIGKKTQIRESLTFTLRADLVNAFNHPQWGDPNIDINSASFGRISCSVSTPASTTANTTCSTTQSASRTILINARVDF